MGAQRRGRGNRCTAYVDTYVGGIIPSALNIADEKEPVLSIVRQIGKGCELSHKIDLENWDMSRPTTFCS